MTHYGWSRRGSSPRCWPACPLWSRTASPRSGRCWTPGHLGLAAANLLVSVFFFATSVFVYAEPGHRLTGATLAAAALLWPLNWVNEWKAGPLPLIAALEGPLYGLLAVWALLRYPAPWPRRGMTSSRSPWSSQSSSSPACRWSRPGRNGTACRRHALAGLVAGPDGLPGAQGSTTTASS